MPKHESELSLRADDDRGMNAAAEERAVNEVEEALEKLFASINSLGNPTCSGGEGVSGSLRADALKMIYSALPHDISAGTVRVFDAGCGYGLAVFAFSIMGASTSCGVDLLSTLPVSREACRPEHDEVAAMLPNVSKATLCRVLAT